MRERIALHTKVKLVRGGVKVPRPPSGRGLASLSALKSRGALADQQVKDLLSLSISEVAVGPLDLGAEGRAPLGS